MSRCPSKGVTGRSQWRVAPDQWDSYVAPHLGTNGGRNFGPNEDQLEPILPEGAAPSVYTFQQLMDSLREVMA